MHAARVSKHESHWGTAWPLKDFEVWENIKMFMDVPEHMDAFTPPLDGQCFRKNTRRSGKSKAVLDLIGPTVMPRGVIKPHVISNWWIGLIITQTLIMYNPILKMHAFWVIGRPDVLELATLTKESFILQNNIICLIKRFL